MQPSESGRGDRGGGGLGGNGRRGVGTGDGGSRRQRNASGGVARASGGTHAVVTPFLQPEIFDDGGLGNRNRHQGEMPSPPTGVTAAAGSSASAPDFAATFSSRGSDPFASDEDKSVDHRATVAHFETGENDSFDSSSFSSSPGKNYVTPDQSFFPSVSCSSSRPIRSNPGSNGSSPSRRALTRPVPSGKTPPRAPATSYTSFLRPRGLQGRVLFAPKGTGVVSVGVPSSDSSTGSSPTRQQRPFPVQQLSSSTAQSHQQTQPSQARIHTSIFSERGRKRRAYSANGPFSSSLSNANACAGAGAGGAVTGVSSPNQPMCQKTPHPMSPGSIGLEGMSIHSPQRDGLLQQSNNYINEAAAGAPPPPPPSFSPENDAHDNTNYLQGHKATTLPPSDSSSMATFSASRRDSSNSSHDVLSGANTPTTMFQTPQTSPRRGGNLCPSSALGSIGGSSVGGGSCFGPYRSRTPSPNPLMLLGGRPCHRRQGSGTSHVSAMSGLSSALGPGASGSDSNPLDTSFDTSIGMSSADIGGDGGRQHKEGEENGESFASPSPLKVQSSPKHVPVMVLTKMTDAENNEDGGAINQEVAGRPKPSSESRGLKSQKDEESAADLDRLLDVALPSGTAGVTTQSQTHSAQPTGTLLSTRAAASHPGPSPGDSVRSFNLSPRKPLPASMMSPGGGSTGSSMLERSPMIETPACAVAAATKNYAIAKPSRRQRRNASVHSSPGSFLSPRRTAEDGRLADLLFGEDDPPSPLLSSSRRGNGTTSKADSSKPPPFPSTTQFCANNGDDMGAVMDGLLSGFNKGHSLSGKQRLESSNSLAFSIGSSTNSLDRMKSDDGFPIKTLSFGGDQSGTSRYSVGTGTTPRRGSFHMSPPSSSQTTPRRNGASNGQSQTASMQLPPGFMVRSVLTPSKSGGSLQKLMDAHRARSKGVSDLDDGSLSDSCDGSQGPTDMFFLNSPEEVAAATIHAQVENNVADSAENADDYAGGRAKKRRSTADSKSSHLPTMPMEISETYRGNQDQTSSEETNDGNGGLLNKDLSSSSSSSTLESTKLSARQSGRQAGGTRSAGNAPKLKKARSVTFSPSPEVSHSVATMNRAASSVQFGGQRILSQTSSSSLYGMDIVQEEPSSENNGERAETTASSEMSMSLNAASAVTPRQNTDSTDPYYFAAISSKSRSESGETLSTPSGSHCNLQNLQSHNKRQSFGSSGSLLAHFNNLNRQESDASLHWGVPSYYGVTRRASSRAESALGLPIGHDEDESSATARPPSSAKAYTPPARDLITPPAQTFSLGIGESTTSSANKCRGMGGRLMLSPPPLPSKWSGNEFEEDGQTFEAPIAKESSSDPHEGRKEQRRKHLCIAAADEDAVRFAIARMEADNNGNDAS